MNSNIPKISVVMAVYNGEPYIKDTIKTILNQTFSDFEFIIVNDCSTDRTAEVVTSFNDSRIVLVNNVTNMGSSKAGNVGVDMAKADYIARIDADDLSSLDRFQKQYDFLEAHKDIAVLGSSFTIIDSNVEKNLVANPEEIAVKLFLGQNCIAHSAVMMRKEIFTKYNLHYNADNPVSQDYELWADVSRQHKIVNLPEHLTAYRVHENQISTKRYREQQDHAARIVTSHLKRLIPEASIYDVKNHLILTGFHPLETNNFGDVILWAENLIRTNSNKEIFDKTIFENYVNQLVLNRKTAFFNQNYFLSKNFSPSLLLSYLRDCKDFDLKSSFLTNIKFASKCFIHYKRK